MYKNIFCTHHISVQEVKHMNSKSTNNFVVPGAKQAIEKLLALYGGECQKSVDFAYVGYYNEFGRGAKP